MASGIRYEDDQNLIKTDGSKLNEVIVIEDTSEESVCNLDSNQGKDTDNTIEPSENVNEKFENVIILGSRVKQSEQEGNIAQRESNVIIVGGGKGKRKNKTELELLGIDIKQKCEDEYGVFGDESKIFKKYKLRNTEQPISYKEPADNKTTHCISSDDETELNCPVCQQEFENKVALLNHFRIHNRTVQEYTCSLCFKKFNKNADLIAHREKHIGESFLCQECKLAFSDYCDYLLHQYEHLSQPVFKCAECGLRYRKSVYKQHIMTHFEKLLSCNLCSFVANGEYNLRAHINQHKYKFPCIECGKVCNCKKDLHYHMSIHTGVKRFQCLYCGVGFRNHNAREVHTRTHTGEKPFTCDICGHKARQWTDLKRHIETHNIEKKYICDLCGKQYTNKYSLVIHMRSHTKKYLYECPECDRKFLSVPGLKSHTMFRHTSERPVECKLCAKKFINKNQYRKHCKAKYHLRNVYGNNFVNVDKKKDE